METQTISLAQDVEDITGPMVGLETMGYAAPAQKTGGLHQRLWARTFVIADPNQTSSRLVYTTTDTCFVTLAVKAEVINRLKKKFGDQFTHTNVMITATHTHSGPGATLRMASTTNQQAGCHLKTSKLS